MTIPVYKVLLVGSSSVGKSSIIRRLLLGEFDDDYTATVGVDLSAVPMNIDAFTPVILTVIDLGGQADFSHLRTQYYKGSHFPILVYDISNRESFESLEDWHDGLMEHIGQLRSSPLLGIVIGNKADLEDRRVVSQLEGRQFAEKIGWVFFETSAKNGQNIEVVFGNVAKECFTRHPPRK